MEKGGTARAETPRGGLHRGAPWGVDAAGLSDRSAASQHAVLRFSAGFADGASQAHARNRSGTHALRLSADSRPPAKGRLVCGMQLDLPPL